MNWEFLGVLEEGLINEINKKWWGDLGGIQGRFYLLKDVSVHGMTGREYEILW